MYEQEVAVRAVGTVARWVSWMADHPARVREWRQVARACGLTNVRELRSLGLTRRVEADAGYLTVTFSTRPPREDDPVRGTVSVGGLAHGLRAPVEPAGRLGGFDVPKGMADVPPVGGTQLLLCALLHARARRLVSALFEGRVVAGDDAEHGFPCRARLEDRTLTVDYEGDLFAHTLEGVLQAARCLDSVADAAAAAAENFRREEHAPVRRHILRTLAAEAPGHAATTATVRAALSDPSDAVRLEAALAAPDEGAAVLRALVSSPETSETTLARAIAALGTGLGSEEVRTLLAHALERRRTRVAIACVEQLGSRGADDTETLVRTLKCGDPGVMVAAAQALGWHAESREAVIALHEARELHRDDRDLGDAVRQSVAAVRERLAGAGTGQLSVAGPEAGTLALAEDGRGRVALDGPEDPPQS